MKSSATAFGFLVLWSVVPHASSAQEESFGRLASLVSRDALLYVWVDDREAVVRRTANTALGRALVEYDSEDLNQLFAGFTAELSIFLDPNAVRGFGYVLTHGRGEAAVSVESIASIGGTYVPEVLAIADRDGLDPLLNLLRRAAAGDDDDDLEDDLEDLDLPFEIDLSAGVSTRAIAGHSAFEFGSAGQRIAVLVHGERVLAAPNASTIQRAIERAENPSFGSLRDSLRFREMWRALDPGRGSLLAYANLRRYRQEARPAIASVEWVRALFEDRLAAFDGVGLAVRGTGERFEATVELERGRATSDEMLLGDNERFGYPGQVPGSTVLLAARFGPEQAVKWATRLLWLGGNAEADLAVDEFVAECGGASAFASIAQACGREFCLFTIARDSQVEPFLRIGARYEVRDSIAIARALDVLATAFPERIRRGKLNSEIYYVVKLAGIGPATEPAFVLRNDCLIAAGSPHHLRLLLDDLDKRPRAERDAAWLAAWDFSDVAPTVPSVLHGYVDSRAFAEAFPVWASPLFPLVSDWPRTGPWVAELFHALSDPDIEDALGAVVFRAESRAGGTRIELHGP